MIDRTHPLSVRQQCHLLNLARSTAYYQPMPVSATTLAPMRRIDELHLHYPFKYEEVYLHAYETVEAAHQGLARYLLFYHQTRPHQALDGQTPDQVYYDHLTTRQTVA